MAQQYAPSQTIPAQLDFFAIYNPSLGPTDETFQDQIVYYYARDKKAKDADLEAGKDRKESGKQSQTADNSEDEKLRQIGLAQGMVDFAKNFSNGVNVDTIDTEKARIVLHEIETGWWFLASVELTRLPTTRQNQDKSGNTGSEYSAREVSPARLLITELIQAHSIFLLHHGTRLSETFERLDRLSFCGLLERYWNRFLKDWDVLLHGNPAVTIHYATKLAGGGELGVGVGEEEWGSGEREVLEGFMDRTEGLIDLIVGRYGEASPEQNAHSAETLNSNHRPTNSGSWLGSGQDTSAADGVIFTGRGIISKSSLRTVSQWMETIFKDGERAYGVGDNPQSRPRQQRKKPKRQTSSNHTFNHNQENHPQVKPPHKSKAPNLRRTAMENNACPPGIPAPLVGQVERSLDEALAKASQQSKGQEPSQNRKTKNTTSKTQSRDGNSSFGVDNMMKYLTLGYGSSWTLNPSGLNQNEASEQRPPAHRSTKSNTQTQNQVKQSISAEEQALQEIDPTPEVSDDETQPFRQRLEESSGSFLIGLSGDLEEGEVTTDNETDEYRDDLNNRAQRIVLRTLLLEIAKPFNPRRLSAGSASRHPYRSSINSASTVEEPKTSAAASVDGSKPNWTHEKVQVAIYVHQPFVFVFLFALHTPNLSIPAFWRSIHNQLGPLQKPLLRSTDPARVAQRIADTLDEASGPDSSSKATANTIHDIVYDTGRLTVRTSIPNIPIPGSLAAEGFRTQSSSLTVSGSWYTLGIPISSSSSPSNARKGDLVKSGWTRVEALNVHSQILNTFLATRNNTDWEYTAKTSRAWWILWMKIAAKGEHAGQREAFLVRKSPDQANTTSRNTSSGPGKWLLRDQPKDSSNDASIKAGTSTAKGVSDAVGVDARKWIEALLHLTQ